MFTLSPLEIFHITEKINTGVRSLLCENLSILFSFPFMLTRKYFNGKRGLFEEVKCFNNKKVEKNSSKFEPF